MKKLIAISVMIALVAGAAFAVDLTGTVMGSVFLIQGDTGENSDLTGGGNWRRGRLDGGGESDDGQFGGYIRVDFADGDPEAHAWWKPIPEFKLIIGSFDDGFWGFEGYAGFMFYQMSSLVLTSPAGGNTWGWGNNYGFRGGSDVGLNFRNSFYGRGFTNWGLGIELGSFALGPCELGVNIGLPYGNNTDNGHFGFARGQAIEDVFKGINAQLLMKFDFGNIAISYAGGTDYYRAGEGAIFAYFGITAIDGVDLDIGVGFHHGVPDNSNPLFVGAATKIGLSDSAALKIRAQAGFLAEDGPFELLADVMPYFTISDTFRFNVSLGLGMVAEDPDAKIGFHVNPYIEIGQEWTPTFTAGIQFYTTDVGADKAVFGFAIPVAIMVSF